MTHRSDSAGSFDVPNNESRSFVRTGRAPMGAVTLGLAAILALGAGEAEAQCVNRAYDPVNPGTPELPILTPYDEISCRYGRDDRRNRAIFLNNPRITVVDDFIPGIEAFHEGIGHLSVYVFATEELGYIPSPAEYSQGITTRGDPDLYVTGEDSYGVHAKHSGEGRVGIDVRNISVRTAGDWAHGVYAWQQGSYIFREDGRSTRARGAVVVNLIETDRDRADRARPLVATRGDNADAVRAEYTRAAARGHIVVTVEGYDIATGGIVPASAIVSTPRRPADYVFDPSRPYARNADHDPDDPSSPEFINILPRDEDAYQRILTQGNLDGLANLIRGIDLRPYRVVYLPRRNPDYNPDADTPESKEFIDGVRNPNYDPDADTPESKEFIAGEYNPGIAIWNGRYFVAQGAVNQADVAACSGLSTAEARRNCYVNMVAARAEDNVPTGFQARGIYATHEGHGDIRVGTTDNVIRTWGAGAQGIYATHTGRTLTLPSAIEGEPDTVTPGGGGVSIVVTGGVIDTQGLDSHGVWARHRGDSGADDADRVIDPGDIGTGGVSIAIENADIDTAGDHARGVYGLIQQTCTASTAEGCREVDDQGNPVNLVAGTGIGDIDITVTRGSITTAGRGGAYAIHARHENRGAIAVRLTSDSDDPEEGRGIFAVETKGHEAHGIFADHSGSAGTVSVTVDGEGSVATRGAGAHGVYGTHAGSGDVKVTIASGVTVTTQGFAAQGVRADLAGDGDLTIEVAGKVTTEGDSAEQGAGGQGAHGVYGTHAGSGDLAIRMTAGAVTAKGIGAHGLFALHTGTAAATVSVTVSGGSVTAEGDGSAGVLAQHGAVARTGAMAVTVGQGASVTGGLVGIQLIADADADGNVPTSTVSVDGTVRGVSSAGIYLPTGGTVNVGATGRVSGASAGILSDGDYDLDVTVAGTVTGDVLGLGTGDHTVMVREGGTVSGTIHLAASTVTVDGTAGRVLLNNGGMVTVGGTGRITGVEGGTEAVRSDTGDLTANLAGMLTGDVLALWDTETHPNPPVHRVMVEEGGDISGTVRVATEVGRDGDDEMVSALTVNGAVGRVQLDQGGALTVGQKGRIRGIDGIAISAPGRSVDLEIQESPEELAGEALDRVAGRIVADERVVSLRPADGSDPLTLGRLGTTEAVPRGPYDLGVDESGSPVRRVAPRGRLYEALPSVMLGLNRLSEYRDRMAAPRDASGGWARVHGSRGRWKADNTWPTVEPRLATSTTVESRRNGIQAGLDASVGEGGLFGVSLHHRTGSATVSNDSIMDVPGAGHLDLSGTGGGISGTWRRDDVYVDLQGEVSWYEADFNSSYKTGFSRSLMQDVSGYGYALGMEAGRRIASGTDGVALIPRAGLVHSKVSLKDFTDSVGSSVSLEDGRSLKGRMGVSVDVETKLSGSSESRFLYSLDVEHELKDETKVSVAGADLTSTAEATWLRAGMNVSHAWDDGRYTIQGGVSYATGGSDSHEYGGGLKLKVRF